MLSYHTSSWTIRDTAASKVSQINPQIINPWTAGIYTGQVVYIEKNGANGITRLT